MLNYLFIFYSLVLSLIPSLLTTHLQRLLYTKDPGNSDWSQIGCDTITGLVTEKWGSPCPLSGNRLNAELHLSHARQQGLLFSFLTKENDCTCLDSLSWFLTLSELFHKEFWETLASCPKLAVCAQEIQHWTVWRQTQVESAHFRKLLASSKAVDGTQKWECGNNTQKNKDKDRGKGLQTPEFSPQTLISQALVLFQTNSWISLASTSPKW